MSLIYPMDRLEHTWGLVIVASSSAFFSYRPCAIDSAVLGFTRYIVATPRFTFECYLAIRPLYAGINWLVGRSPEGTRSTTTLPPPPARLRLALLRRDWEQLHARAAAHQTNAGVRSYASALPSQPSSTPCTPLESCGTPL